MEYIYPIDTFYGIFGIELAPSASFVVVRKAKKGYKYVTVSSEKLNGASKIFRKSTLHDTWRFKGFFSHLKYGNFILCSYSITNMFGKKTLCLYVKFEK